MSIYVEILVRAPMDALWSHTQMPALHERWDLRFSRIEYLPRKDETEPQRFVYATRIGFGLEVSGEGETAGRRDSTDGSSTSSLTFGSDEASRSSGKAVVTGNTSRPTREFDSSPGMTTERASACQGCISTD
jgi:hypothetical protein